MFFNTGIITCAVIRMRGGDPTLMDGFRVAFARVPVLLGWALPVKVLPDQAPAMFTGNPVFDLLTGGLLLGAFFMATDMVTSPMTKRGAVIFGLGCGILTMVLRKWSPMPEGVCFSILLMNSVVPLINRATKPRIFGQRREK